MTRMRKHLTYANVMATIAVFIALGGSSYAAITITGRDVKNGSLTSRDLKRNTLGGTRIQESRLGTVPKAKAAGRVGSYTATRLLVRCPAGTLPLAGTCVERAARAAQSYTQAVAACAAVNKPKTAGRRLPSINELLPLIGAPGATLAPGGELTRDVTAGADGRIQAVVLMNTAGGVTAVPDGAEGARAFRCAVDPLNG